MKLSDYLIDYISNHTEHIFTGQGGCIVHLIDSLDRHPTLKYTPCQNEQGAAIAAEAYARVSGKLGVAMATSGPGVINLIQGIACAYFDSIPTLFISGQAPTGQLKGKSRARQIGFQETDIVAMVKPITKYAVLITNPKKLKIELDKLIAEALGGRPGPVILDLPDDIQRAEI